MDVLVSAIFGPRGDISSQSSFSTRSTLTDLDVLHLAYLFLRGGNPGGYCVNYVADPETCWTSAKTLNLTSCLSIVFFLTICTGAEVLVHCLSPNPTLGQMGQTR